MENLISKDYKLEKDVQNKKEIEEDKTGVPVYYEKLNLTDQDKERLVKEIFDELEEIKQERKDELLEELWEALDMQYEGKLEEDKRMQFNLNQNITKVKVNRVSNLVMQAFMKSDPKFSISPEPEYTKLGGLEICEKQSDFLDYKLDNLPFRPAEGMVVHNAVLKGTGILKIYHKIKREKRKREEVYKGENIPVIDKKTGQIAMSPENKPVFRNPGLEEFLKNWEGAEKKYPGYVKQLAEGKTIEIVASYTETTYNDPHFSSVDLKDFYVRKSAEGYEGLKSTKLTAERICYSWWDLELAERKGDFENIDEVKYQYKTEGGKKVKTDKTIQKYENKEYDVFECVYYFKLKETDEEEVKIVCWIEEETRTVLGAILYPLYAIDCYYIPHYISKKKQGFYQFGIGEDLTDSNMAESFLLNFLLEGAYTKNMITPIADEKSPIHAQFLNKEWTHGIPMAKKTDETIDFLQRYMPQQDISGMMALINYLKQGDDDITGVSSLMSGKHDPLDPQAPASKTIALLEQSGVNIEDYILAISPAFNEIGQVLLNMYYQISKEGRKYSMKRERAQFNNPFGEISRNELRARTNIQVQAYAFDFDKLNEKKENVAFYQLVRQEPLVAQNPEAVWYLLRTITKSWSPQWRNQIEMILPNLEELKRKELQVAIQAVDTYMKAKMQEAEATGVNPELTAQEFLPLLKELQSLIATPPSKEQVKEMENKKKGKA